MKLLITIFLVFSTISAFAADVFCSPAGNQARLEVIDSGKVVFHLTKDGSTYEIESQTTPTFYFEGENNLKEAFPKIAHLIEGSRLIKGEGYSFIGRSKTVSPSLLITTFTSDRNEKILLVKSGKTRIFSGTTGNCF